MKHCFSKNHEYKYKSYKHKQKSPAPATTNACHSKNKIK